MRHAFAKPVESAPPNRFRYSICTLVTRWDQYEEMLSSFTRAGFDPAFCEFLYIDNSSGGGTEAFAGCNSFLASAQGEYVIICHQDVQLEKDGIKELDAAIRELDQRDPAWALLGSAGGVRPGERVTCVTDSYATESAADFPVKVQSLDEIFILAKRSARLCVSHDLQGFHFYGTDLCQIARALGRTAWVVRFRVRHCNDPRFDPEFVRLRAVVIRKYSAIYRSGCIQTACTELPISRSRWADHHALFEYTYAAAKLLHRAGLKDFSAPQAAAPLGKFEYAAHWLWYKVSRPLVNLGRSLRKRSQKPQSGAGPA